MRTKNIIPTGIFFGTLTVLLPFTSGLEYSRPSGSATAISSGFLQKDKTQDANYQKVAYQDDRYWKTLEEIESKSGKMLYRKGDKSCATTKKACGYHQLTWMALKDIGCTSKDCLLNREVYSKSLQMAKKYETVLKRYGCSFDDYRRYLCWQMGASGISRIIKASKGKENLPRKIIRNMANNSLYTYRELRFLGSKKASISFLREWRERFENAQRRIAGI